MARIVLSHPTPPGLITGNRVTADRWRTLLGSLGHRVKLVAGGPEDLGDPGDLLIALHALKSARIVLSTRGSRPDVPIVLVLTGTDLYRDLARRTTARAAVRTADRLVVLHPRAARDLPVSERKKVSFVPQSVRMPRVPRSRRGRFFDVAVLANLRRVKDPMRAAMAARALPCSSRIRVVHAGTVIDRSFEAPVRREVKNNPRYEWKGPLPRWQAKRLLAGSSLVVVSSRLEGGANVISEAAVAGVPVLASRMAGNVGLLGEEYPGYFPVGDTDGLTELLHRAEGDAAFLSSLRRHMVKLGPTFHPARERAALRGVLGRVMK